MRVAFLGLGVMGGPMARWLAANGHAVTVWNRTQAKSEAWLAGLPENVTATVAGSIEAAVSGAEVVLACVGDDPDALAVGAIAIATMAPGGLYVDHTTTSAKVARELAGLAAGRSIGFVDAPVSGGQAGAENGRLTAMCGGTEDDVQRAEGVLGAYCATIVRIGDAGAGQLAKMVNQIAIAGVVQGLSEAVHFAKANGLDTTAVLGAISKGAAGSWQMDNRWPTMVAGKYDFGFAVDWMRKDLRIVLEQAAASGANLELTALVDGFYAQVQAAAGGRLDTSSLLTRLEPLKPG
jgi:3-hydroxyisobutyrate dehydrogenase